MEAFRGVERLKDGVDREPEFGDFGVFGRDGGEKEARLGRTLVNFVQIASWTLTLGERGMRAFLVAESRLRASKRVPRQGRHVLLLGDVLPSRLVT